MTQRQISSSWETNHQQTQQQPNILRQQSVRAPENSDSIFAVIIEQKVIKSVNIINYTKESDHQSLLKKHIVIYTIEVKTDFFDYRIGKRYSEFKVLHDQINTLIELPKFPEQTLIKTNSTKNIQKRLEGLTLFLQAVMLQLDHQLYKFLEFIQIKPHYVKGYGDFKFMHELSKEDMTIGDLKLNGKFQPSNDQEKNVLHQISKLNNEDQRAKRFQKMEKYFFGKTHMISYNMLKYLFLGDEEKILGIIQLSYDPSHISCISGLQFIRKLLEFDYNSLAESANKAFNEMSVKQFKTMHINTHISRQGGCKNDALQLLHKYIQGSGLGEQYYGFLIEDPIAIEEYQQYSTQLLQSSCTKKEFDQFNFEHYVLNEEAATKSNSKEQALLLDGDPSIEQLEEMLNKSLNWKSVVKLGNHHLHHIQGQYVRTIHHLSCSLERAVDLLTKLKNQWLIASTGREVLVKIDEGRNIVLETYVWMQKQQYKTVVFIVDEEVIKSADKVIIRISSVKDHSIYDRPEEVAQKVSFVEIQQEANGVKLTILQNLHDKSFRMAYSPILLNECNLFQKSCDKLDQLSQS